MHCIQSCKSIMRRLNSTGPSIWSLRYTINEWPQDGICTADHNSSEPSGSARFQPILLFHLSILYFISSSMRRLWKTVSKAFLQPRQTTSTASYSTQPSYCRRQSDQPSMFSSLWIAAGNSQLLSYPSCTRICLPGLFSQLPSQELKWGWLTYSSWYLPSFPSL